MFDPMLAQVLIQMSLIESRGHVLLDKGVLRAWSNGRMDLPSRASYFQWMALALAPMVNVDDRTVCLPCLLPKADDLCEQLFTLIHGILRRKHVDLDIDNDQRGVSLFRKVSFLR